MGMYECRVRTVFAGPTTGKTTIAIALLKHGYRVYDTDEVVRKLYPEWYARKLWRHATDLERASVDAAVGVALSRAIGDREAWIFSNLWGPTFRSTLHELGLMPQLVADAYYYRSGEDVSELSRRRGDKGGGIDRALATHWANSVEKYGLAAAREVHRVPAGRFLVDYIRLPPGVAATEKTVIGWDPRPFRPLLCLDIPTAVPEPVWTIGEPGFMAKAGM